MSHIGLFLNNRSWACFLTLILLSLSFPFICLQLLKNSLSQKWVVHFKQSHWFSWKPRFSNKNENTLLHVLCVCSTFTVVSQFVLLSALGSVRVAASRLHVWEFGLMMALGAAGWQKLDVQRGKPSHSSNINLLDWCLLNVPSFPLLADKTISTWLNGLQWKIAFMLFLAINVSLTICLIHKLNTERLCLK